MRNCAIVLQIMDKPWDTPNGNRSFSDRLQLEAFNENYRVYARNHALPFVDHFADWQRLQAEDPTSIIALCPIQHRRQHGDQLASN